MKEEVKPDWDLTAKHLAGETTKAEQERIHNWEIENPENTAEIDRLGDAWNLSASDKNLYKINDDKAWINVKSRINELEKGKTEKKGLHVFTSRFARMAAGILLLTAIAGGLYMITGNLHSPSGMLTAINEETTPLTIKLSDGSIVNLNKGARLEYPEKFTVASREVTLYGEAFFEVQHDALKQFVVHTSSAAIRDIGTSFCILANQESNEVRVIVETGKVELIPTKHEVPKIVLEKGNFGSYNSNESRAVRGNNTDINYLSWKTRLIKFQDTPMNEVAEILNKTYHTEISISSEKLRKCKFTGSFKEESLNTVIKVLQTAFHLNIDAKDKKIILSGKGC